MKTPFLRLAICLTSLTLGANAIRAQAGSLDTSFGSGGIAAVFGVSASISNGVVQADGKIIKFMGGIGGSSGTGYIVRWNADGTPDASFDGDGVLALSWPAAGGGYGGMAELALQDSAGSQKIVIVGYTKVYSNGKKMVDALRVDRLNSDGTVDITFGTGGSFVRAGSYANSLAVQADGKIVVSGGTVQTYAAIRLLPNGGLDTTFGAGGIVSLTSLLSPRTVAVLPDGKVLIAGSVPLQRRDVMGAVRFNPNGSVDTSFGSSGKAVIDFGDNSRAFDIAIRTDGPTTSIVLGGSVGGPAATDFAIARLTGSGQLDSAFSGGKVTYDFAGQSDTCYGVSFQSDGKLIAAGYGRLATNDFAMLRYNPDGTLDGAFGTDGRVTTDVFGASEYTSDVMIQNYGTLDERIILVGVASTGGGNYTLAARYSLN